MKKKIFVAMMIGCMILGGCGGSGDNTATTDSDNYEVEYDAEDDVLDASDGLAGEDYASDEDVGSEENETEVETEAVEAEGIIAMIRQTTVSASGGYTDVQIISINPETGAQNVISEFHLNHITYAELQRAEEIDNDTEIYYAQPETFSVYGNNRDWFSDDFTKMKADRTYANNNNEFHAGWVDSDGTFFDVTEAIGAVGESSFSNPGPVAQRARGFDNWRFVFTEIDETKSGKIDNTRKYCVPLNNISADSLHEASEDDLYNNGGFSPLGYPTAQVDEKTYIMDKYNSGLMCPSSFIANLETGETEQYIPESERYNWSGVLSPDGSTVAFLSIPSNGGGNVELYTVPLEGGEPTNVSVVANGDVFVNITALPNSDLAITPGLGDVYCFLLDWR